MSEVAKKSVPDPLAASTTLIPKRTLSYRWVISDVKLILDKQGSIKSPTFSVTLPRKAESSDHQYQSSLWHLNLKKEGGKIYVDLNHGNREKTSGFVKSSSNSSKVEITECTFSIVNSEMKEAMYSKTDKSFGECVIGGPQKRCADFTLPCTCTDIDKYLCKDTLTVQIDATLICFTDPSEAIEGEHKLQEESALTRMKGLFEDKAFMDLTIKCGDEEFKAHKAVLALQSPVFRKMLETDMKEQRSNVIEISDIDPKVISDMLSYLYTGSAPNMDTLAKELLCVANKYGLLQLLSLCEDKLKSEMNVTNVVELLLLADLHNASYLKKACLNYMYHNSAEVYRTSQWKQLRENCDQYASLLIEIIEFSP